MRAQEDKMVIQVQELTRTFSVPRRDEGLLAAIKSVFKRDFEIKKAVDNISFEIKKGEIIGFLGPNGAGKSTTIKMLTGILKPSSGTIRVLGYDPFVQRKEYVKHIGALFGQKSQLWWDIPAIDAYGLSEKLYDIDREEFVQRRDDLIRRLEIQEEVHKPVRNLSLGERMKCEFVMAVLHQPDILFLDEPTIGLDVFAKEHIREFIKYINKEFSTTIILTTHDMDDIEHLAGRVIVISNGEIVFDDSLKKLQRIGSETKKIRVVTKKALDSLKKAGISDVSRVGKYEASFKLDTSKLSLADLITSVSANNTIQDLEVSAFGVEEIIKKLYR